MLDISPDSPTGRGKLRRKLVRRSVTCRWNTIRAVQKRLNRSICCGMVSGVGPRNRGGELVGDTWQVGADTSCSQITQRGLVKHFRSVSAVLNASLGTKRASGHVIKNGRRRVANHKSSRSAINRATNRVLRSFGRRLAEPNRPTPGRAGPGVLCRWRP